MLYVHASSPLFPPLKMLLLSELCHLFGFKTGLTFHRLRIDTARKRERGLPNSMLRPRAFFGGYLFLFFDTAFGIGGA
jgi:hypothetical protein